MGKGGEEGSMHYDIIIIRKGKKCYYFFVVLPNLHYQLCTYIPQRFQVTLIIIIITISYTFIFCARILFAEPALVSLGLSLSDTHKKYHYLYHA